MIYNRFEAIIEGGCKNKQFLAKLMLEAFASGAISKKELEDLAAKANIKNVYTKLNGISIF